MYTGTILDPIHGIIRVSEIEKWIISQKVFSRLRRIKQNTFLYLVFPSAIHTRFEHSLGVMHLAHEIYLNADKNFKTGDQKNKKYGNSTSTKFKFCSVKNLLGDHKDVFIQELRLAALMHDIGHGPMSHLFDNFSISKENLFEIINNDTELNPYLDNFKHLLKGKNKVEHEILSCVFTIKIIKNLKFVAENETKKFSKKANAVIQKLDPIRIVKMIEPDFSSEGIIYCDYNFSNYCNAIISSFPLDADRMDYLQRDSYFSGVKYGIYDLSRVLMSLIPIEENKKISLSIKESGIDSAIRFIESRTHLFNQIYYHKTNRAANKMLEFACRNLHQTPIIDAHNYEQLEEFYWRNSDEYFLFNTIQEKTNDIENKVLNDLLNRKLWKRVSEKRIVKSITLSQSVKNDPVPENIEQRISEVKRKLEKKEIYIEFDYPSNIVLNGVNKTKLKIVEKKDSNYNIKDNWIDFNLELERLNYKSKLIRIYVRRDFKSSKDFKKKKQLIQKHTDKIIQDLTEHFSQ